MWTAATCIAHAWRLASNKRNIETTECLLRYLIVSVYSWRDRKQQRQRKLITVLIFWSTHFYQTWLITSAYADSTEQITLDVCSASGKTSVNRLMFCVLPRSLFPCSIKNWTWQSPAWRSASAVLQTPNFCGNMRKFRYHGNRGRLVSSFNDIITLPVPDP